MLHLIGSRHGPALARQVAASFLTTPRPGSEPQIAPTRPADPRLDPRVAQAVARMEARIGRARNGGGDGPGDQAFSTAAGNPVPAGAADDARGVCLVVALAGGAEDDHRHPASSGRGGGAHRFLRSPSWPALGVPDPIRSAAKRLALGGKTLDQRHMRHSRASRAAVFPAGGAQRAAARLGLMTIWRSRAGASLPNWHPPFRQLSTTRLLAAHLRRPVP